MLEINSLKKYDVQKMYKIYDKWPQIAEDSYNFQHKEIEFEKIDHIVFVGMGGSGAIGDMFSAILSKTNFHVSVVKGYVLPNNINSNSLVITTSISGNTSETLTVLNLANIKKCKIIAISSGGKMEKYCMNHSIDFWKMPLYHSPRASFIGFSFSLLKILKKIIPISEKQVNESLNELKKMQKNISSSNLTNSNLALELANWIKEIPLIYYPWGLNAAANRFKSSLQENSKLHVIVEDVIEAGHNGIVAWEKISSIQPILLQGDEDNIKTKERWKIMKEYFEKNNIEYKQVYSVRGNILTKISNLIYLFDFTSIYKAVLTKTDPSPIESINFIKQKLSNDEFHS